VIEAFWNHAADVPNYTDEDMARARYEGSIIGDPPFDMDMNVPTTPSRCCASAALPFMFTNAVVLCCGCCSGPSAGDPSASGLALHGRQGGGVKVQLVPASARLSPSG
jgi:hypothetical protein